MNQAELHRYLSAGCLNPPQEADKKALFEQRLTANLTLIQDLFFSLYPESEYEKSFAKLLAILPILFEGRPEGLKLRDLEKMKEGNWYLSQKMAGMQLYVDHFSKDLKGLKDKLPYLQDLGINFLHLMPITTRPQKENDGGYAVNGYTQIDRKFGTKKDLASLTEKMRDKGMYLMLDFVVNHTSDEYPWATKAKKGSKKYQSYYYTYPDRVLPDEFELSLPEVFPETSPGNFTYDKEMGQWVMTVFNRYQWDLNYTNPEVFLAMLENLVNLANLGVDVVRFDALAFLWKKLGTISQNLPQAHRLISLFRLCLQVVAPGVILLAEAIVPPREIMKYFGEGIYRGNECEVAYNATFMALLWNSIATRETEMMRKSLEDIQERPESSTWINYVRCHDDIGLGFDDRFIYEMGWTPGPHRRFLLDYYCQRLDWSPAKGQIFMHNPKTGDGRITGSAASLLGLEKALEENDREAIKMAVSKIIMMHGLILSYGGIPMIYAGDELGALNDYSYLKEEGKKQDSRWVNRPRHQWDEINKELSNKDSVVAEVYSKLKNLIALRKEFPCLADHNNLDLLDLGNQHIFAFERRSKESPGIVVLANFEESPQVIDSTFLKNLGYAKNGCLQELIKGKKIKLRSGLLEIQPYELLWFQQY
ncbi:amylosucrase [Lentiprolixibacter aurantiacus]|uniref:Amylosucrase n=1 Tax=Lentiprolixibacter aurantiacus TaxID=2993939 RepID=A0AAE3SM49_9FLAO|nr:amylosucrase [Lentiprolixibacter aurantiacus]MCX2718362.1 amylosucrase [Lentiprolixibacter aurantiacus]